MQHNSEVVPKMWYWTAASVTLALKRVQSRLHFRSAVEAGERKEPSRTFRQESRDQ